MPKKKFLARSMAVEKATGKTWAQWFKILDRFPKTKSHTERAQWLYDHHLKLSWWCQMVTVTYEQHRGLRKKHETVTGYQVSASRTLRLSMNALYSWWTTKRGGWLKVKDVAVTSTTRNKYLHLAWPDGTKVDVNFWKVNAQKSMVQVQHSKLKNASAAKRAQAWWTKQLDQFVAVVSKPVASKVSSSYQLRRS